MGKQVWIDAGLENPPDKLDNQWAQSINNILDDSIPNPRHDKQEYCNLSWRRVWEWNKAM